MTYSGTILRDLESMVEACLRRDSRICAVCRQLYRDHSVIGAYCPDLALPAPAYLPSRFAEPCDADALPDA